jgi:hypothetical protein
MFRSGLNFGEGPRLEQAEESRARGPRRRRAHQPQW